MPQPLEIALLPSIQTKRVAAAFESPLYGLFFRTPEYATALGNLEPATLLGVELDFRKTLTVASEQNPAIRAYIESYTDTQNRYFPLAPEFESLSEGISPDRSLTFTVHATAPVDRLTFGDNTLILQNVHVHPKTIDFANIALALQSLPDRFVPPVIMDPIVVSTGHLTRSLEKQYEQLAGRFAQAWRDITLTPFSLDVIFDSTSVESYSERTKYSDRIKTSLPLLTWITQMRSVMEKISGSRNLLIYHPSDFRVINPSGRQSTSEVENFFIQLISANPEREHYDTYRQVRMSPQAKATITADGKTVINGTKELSIHSLFISLNTAFANRIITALGDMGRYTKPIYDHLVSTLAKGGSQAESRYFTKFQIAASLLTWHHRLIAQYIDTSPYLVSK